MGWGDCLTLSEIGYEYLSPTKDSSASGAGAVMSWASTEKAEDQGLEGTVGLRVGYCL